MSQALAQSPLATLAERTDTATVLAGSSDHVKGLVQLTGQYLYDRFIANDGEQVTKMQMVRAWVTQYDVATFRKAMGDFVKIAKEYGEAKQKTAQNHRTVMQWAYGSMRFAMPQLVQLGWTETTGYQEMRVLGKKACEQRSINWDGTPAKPKLDKETKERAKIETEALANVRTQNPQRAGESVIAWEKRVLDLVDMEVERIETARSATAMQDAANEFLVKCQGHEDAAMHVVLSSFAAVEQTKGEADRINALASAVKAMLGEDITAVMEVLLEEYDITSPVLDSSAFGVKPE